MTHDKLVQYALKLMQSEPAYVQDAREGIAVSNTIIGSVMSLILKAPRQFTEAAVREALRRFDTVR
jgi:hypothetical protein